MTDALDLANRFFTSIEAGDLDTVREVFAPDAITTTNFGGDSDVDQTIKVMGWLHRKSEGLRYEIVRREAIEGGFLQEHVLRATAPDGTEVAMPACIVATVDDGHITKLREYLDPTHVEPLSRKPA